MIELNDIEVNTLLQNMGTGDDDYDVRQIAVMEGPTALEFTDADSGELFSPATVARIYAAARTRLFRCESCSEDLPIDKWTRDSHGVDLCAACLFEAELENEHSDGGHEGEPHPACAACR